MKQLKIALVVDHFLPRIGGIELQVAELARQLSARGHRVVVVTTTPGPVQIDRLIVHRIRASLLPKFQILWHAGPLLALRRYLEEQRFDVIHCHASVVSPLAFTTLGLAAKSNTACVLTTHSFWNRAPYLLRALGWVWPWNHLACQFTAVSRFVIPGIARAARRSDISVLPNGIDRLPWQIDHTPGPELRVTSVMRLNNLKCPYDLLRAWAVVTRRLPRLRPRLTIIGDGPCRRRLDRQAHRLGIADSVEFLGFQPRDKICEVFRTTDLFALPTRHEAFGIAVLEASCAKLPILAMRDAGVGEIVTHGEHGLLAADQNEFVDYLQMLLEDGELRGRLASASREHFAQFEWERVIARHLEIYAKARLATGGEVDDAQRRDVVAALS